MNKKQIHLQKMIEVLGSRYFELTDLPDEHWLPLSSWKGCDLKFVYQVSDKDRLKNNRGELVPGNIDPHGYHSVVLRYADPTIGKNSFIHSLVITAFVGPPPSEMLSPTVQHIDHNPLNNCIDNLEWMELADNCRDAQAIKIRIIDKGEEHIFESKEIASTDYCNKASGYINDCMKLSIPVVNKFGREVDISYSFKGTSEWIEYIPSKRLKPWRLGCIILDSEGQHEFKSLSSAHCYLGRKDGYIQYKRTNNLPIISAVTGETVDFRLLNENEE